MHNLEIGRRYERLLFLTAPVSIVSLLLLFVAMASNTQSERVTARCYDLAANSIQSNIADLKAAWDTEKPITQEQYWGIQYKLALQKTIIYAHLGTNCYKLLDEAIQNRYRASPEDIISEFRKDSKVKVDTPFAFGGVELPDQATVSIFGIGAKVSVMSFAQMLQVVLGPLLVLWLGSLYNTRYRESLLVNQAKHLSDVFPHLINIYPSGAFREPRKRSWWRQHIPGFVALTYSCTRVGLLSVFILPPVISYIASLILLGSGEYNALFVVLGALVAIFALTTLLAEFLPWHFGKLFPVPRIGADQGSG